MVRDQFGKGELRSGMQEVFVLVPFLPMSVCGEDVFTVVD